MRTWTVCTTANSAAMIPNCFFFFFYLQKTVSETCKSGSLLTKMGSCQWKLQLPNIVDHSKIMYCCSYFVGACAATLELKFFFFHIRRESIHIWSTKYNTPPMSFTGSSLFNKQTKFQFALEILYEASKRKEHSHRA